EAFDGARLQPKSLQERPKLDVIVLEMPSLDIHIIDKYSKSIDERVVVVYHFGTTNDLHIATERGLDVVPWPSTWQQIEEACLRSGRRSSTTAATQRRFSEEQLFHFATNTSIESCACPRDLVQLITQINAYAIHAERCGTVDTAANHFEIALEANAARACLENALSVIVEVDGSVQKAN
ncbi:MAG: hypothetical protein VX697_03205, partial [Pseudomonadota bacterium]|nr:hypothetical protein [Pseudomonadota bacterium]